MKKIFITSILCCLLLISSIFISSVQASIVKNEIEKKVEENKFGDYAGDIGHLLSKKVNTLMKCIFESNNMKITKILLILLAIIDIPFIIVSIVLTFLVYLAYIPTMLVALIDTIFFWDAEIPIAISPVALVFIVFNYLMLIAGSPIYFFVGTIQYILDIENEDLKDYLLSSLRWYSGLIKHLLGYDLLSNLLDGEKSLNCDNANFLGSDVFFLEEYNSPHYNLKI